MDNTGYWITLRGATCISDAVFLNFLLSQVIWQEDFEQRKLKTFYDAIFPIFQNPCNQSFSAAATWVEMFSSLSWATRKRMPQALALSLSFKMSIFDKEKTLKLRDSASSLHWLSSSIFICSLFVPHSDISSYLHYMTF